MVSGLAVLLFAGGVVAATEPVDLDPDKDLTGEGTEASPYNITNASELQAMRGNLTAHYELGETINATNTSQWDGTSGFEPIGNDTHPFEGSFDGNGFAIENLTVDRGDRNYVGLFGNAVDGTEIGNVTLRNATVTGNAHIGTLVGETNGEVYAVRITGTVTTDLTDSSTAPNGYGATRSGGVVGMLENSGTVTNVTAHVDITGTTFLYRFGGLVGYSNGEIRDSKATGNVTGSIGIGGLVGRNVGLIENATATGNVTGVGDPEGTIGAIGGLVGFNGPITTGTGTVTLSHATGTVSATDGGQIGGLVGSNKDIVNKSYATGAVDGQNRVGGLVGRNTNSELV